jgi:hypothetical protein
MRLPGLLIASVALAGCAAPTVHLKMTVPARTRIVGVRGVAVAGFSAESLDGTYASADGGSWSRRPVGKKDLDSVALTVKNDLMGTLAETPHYNLIDMEGMESIYRMEDLAGLVGKPTFKPGDVDALIFGRVWVGYLEADGTKHEKQTLEHWNYRGQQPQLVSQREILVQSAYKQASAVLVVQYTMVRLQPRLEIVLVHTSIESLRQDEGGGIRVSKTRGGPLGLLTGGIGAMGGGGRKEGKTETAGEKPSGGTVPLALESFTYLAHEACRDFVESISPTTKEYDLELADGDEEALVLIRANAYREASRKLSERVKGLYKNPTDVAADYFNLGIAYEAQGPAWYLDAIEAYRKAVENDPEKEFYATGLGRIARLLEGTSLLELQRSEREGR